jgi:hypothetical protein
MMERRQEEERREDNRSVLNLLRKQIEEVHHRVFNGMPKEIREEVQKELAGVRKLVIGILVALLLALTGIVVEGRVSTNQASAENNRTYKAIIDISSELRNHILLTEPRKVP